MSAKNKNEVIIGGLLGFLLGVLLLVIDDFKIYYLLVGIGPIFIIYILDAVHITNFIGKWNHLKIEDKYKSLKFSLIASVLICYTITVKMSESHFSFDPKVECSIVGCSSLICSIIILIAYSLWRLGEEGKRVSIFKEARKPERG